MRTGLMAMVTIIAVALAGCSSSGAAAPPAKASDHNDADVQFAQLMIPHHQQTIQMADIATQKATGQDVRVVAASVLSAEEKEIRLMKGWLTAWGATQPMSAEHGGHDMAGMLSTKDMQALQAASGAEFDKKWVELIEKHMQNSVTMSKKVITEGQHAETRSLAMHIVDSQEKKLKEVQALG